MVLSDSFAWVTHLREISKMPLPCKANSVGNGGAADTQKRTGKEFGLEMWIELTVIMLLLN